MKKIMLIVYGLFLCNASLAQKKTEYTKTNTWFFVFNQFELSEKVIFSLETHDRLGGFFRDQAFLLIRPSIDYTAKEGLDISLGYSYVGSWPYEPYPLPIRKSEHNIWEQALFKFQVGKTKFQNRFRQEHRWSGRIVLKDSVYSIDGTDYANRFRFRFTAVRDLLTLKNEDKVFLQVFDEIWVNQNAALLPTAFSRNWLYAGLGYAFSSNVNVQIGYMHQWDKIGENHYISSPIIQTSLLMKWSAN